MCLYYYRLDYIKDEFVISCHSGRAGMTVLKVLWGLSRMRQRRYISEFQLFLDGSYILIISYERGLL